MKKASGSKKLLVILLAAALCLSLLSAGVLAAEEETAAEQAAVEEIEGPVPEEPAEEPAGEEAGEPAAEADAEPAGEPAAEADGEPDGEPVEEAGAEEEPAADGAPGGSSSGGGSSSSSVTWSGATTITSATTQSGQTYTSTTASQNALLINTSGAVTVTNPTVIKNGGSTSGDNASFYGINAAVMVKGGTTTTIRGGTVTSSVSGANGVFCYGGNGARNGATGDGTTLYIYDTVINTTGSGSGGIMTTGGGVTYAYDLTVTTSGGSSAPIRTDRGGGTVVVDGGTYTSNGTGSPAIYSTADITVKNATLVSNTSEGVCIEGKNSITLINCDLTANNTKMNGNAQFYDSIMIYQSMSGDADSGTSSFTMTGGSLTSRQGHVFHVTNTNAVINLTGVQINNEHSLTAYKTLLSVCDDGWSGASNIATLNASSQVLEGGILVGSDSTLNLNLTNGSVFTGYFYGVITNYKGSTVSSSIGTVNVTLDATSKIYLQADAYVTSFSGNPANVVTNGHTMYVKGVALAGTTDSESPAETIPADANGDGVVTARDALLAARFAAGVIAASELDTTAADINGDGVITARDALLIARMAAGVTA